MTTKDARQELCEKRFIETGGCGTLIATTAFGKTRVAINLIRYMRRTKKDRNVIIVVPRENLRDQWEAELLKAGERKNTHVLIINTAAKYTHSCDFLIIDEIHRAAADVFSKVFDTIRYRFVLGLTGTLKRLDKKHTIIEEKCPVFDVITLREAKMNKWVSDFLEVNLGIALGPEDKESYDAMEEKYNKCMDLFGWDFALMSSCTKSLTPLPPVTKDGKIIYLDPPAVEFARKKGWRGSTAHQAWKRYTGKIKPVWGDELHPYSPRMINMTAIQGVRFISAIRKFINDHPSKVNAAVEIISKFDRKTITFAESTSIADELTKRLNAIYPFPFAKSYHSALPSIIVAGKKLSKKATGEYVLESFKLNDCTFLNTAKKLDEGADFPDVTQGIRLAGTSSPTQQTQRRGRIIRAREGKFALMWNVYLKGTKELGWLKRAQGYSHDVLWVESIDEVTEFLHEDE